MSFITVLVILFLIANVHAAGMLFPRESESRQIQDLCGMWNFRADMSINRREGFDKQWYSKSLAEVIIFLRYVMLCIE